MDRCGSRSNYSAPNGADCGSPHPASGGCSSGLALVAGYAALPVSERGNPQPELHLEVDRPRELVQFDCFHIGRLAGTKGTLGQYTAIDVASSYIWAELHATPRNPATRWTSRLARRVARDLSAWGRQLDRAMTDNSSEFRAGQFGRMVDAMGRWQRFIHAIRPRTNGCVERVLGTILGVLEAVVRPLAGAQADRPAARTEPVPALIQPRSGPYRKVEPRADSRGSHREGQNLLLRSSRMCRHFSETGQPSWARLL